MGKMYQTSTEEIVDVTKPWESIDVVHLVRVSSPYYCGKTIQNSLLKRQGTHHDICPTTLLLATRPMMRDKVNHNPAGKVLGLMREKRNYTPKKF